MKLQIKPLIFLLLALSLMSKFVKAHENFDNLTITDRNNVREDMKSSANPVTLDAIKDTEAYKIFRNL